MGIRDDVLALADELDGVSTKENCDACLASGTELCRGDLECAESAHKACAKRLREIVEHDAGEVTTMSAYDLLPEDEREAIAWVRAYGGLDAVKAFVRQAEMEHGYLLKIAHALGASIYDGSDNADALLEKLSERLMPGGMEWLLEVWPKWSNGEYCKFGDWWTAATYGYYEPKQLRRLGLYTPGQLKEWEQDEGDNYGYEWDFMRPSDTTYRPDKVEPPMPKVLDADGEEIREGDVLYSVETGDYVIVDSIEPGNPWFVITDGSLQHCAKFTHERPVLDMDGVEIRVGDTVCGTRDMEPMRVVDTDSRECGFKHIKCEKEGDGFWFYCPDELTHKLPVIAADGKPLREGETVYDVEDEKGYPYIVTSTELDGFGHVKTTCEEPTPASVSIHPNRLTHEQPDSWKRLEKDAEKTVCEYFGANYDCANCPLESARCAEEAKKDIIRRARKLAKKESR